MTYHGQFPDDPYYQTAEEEHLVIHNQLYTELNNARLAVSDWHDCASVEELARWRAAQQKLIEAAIALGQHEAKGAA